MNSLTRDLLGSAETYARRTAVRWGNQALTYHDLRVEVATAAGLIRAMGAEPGDRIALLLPNVPAFPVLFHAVQWAGCVAVPMNPLLTAREIEFCLRDSGARIAFACEESADAAAEAARQTGSVVVTVTAQGLTTEQRSGQPLMQDPAAREDEDTAVILYTSGTTGTPKGAELTGTNLSGNAVTTAATLIEATPDDVVMGCLPLFHVFGLTCALSASLLSGACLTLLTRFDPQDALDVIARDRVTVFEGVPTMYSALLHAPGRSQADTSSLRVCISGGAALPVAVLHEFEQSFDCTILEGYGLSEASPVVCFNHPSAPRRAGSIGTPIADVEVALFDDDRQPVPVGTPGELAVRGPNVMKGYWNNPKATAAALHGEWLLTGDIAVTDEDGYYRIVDRKKDLIIRGGYNVYPREVEEILHQHPAVAEAVVVGIPDDHYGEEIGAAIVLVAGATATSDELRTFVRAEVAPYKYPRRIWFTNVLPKGATGKILRRAVEPPETESNVRRPGRRP
ncbi:long-chain fatty acid--CoA ligase [Streptomyces sp. Lzd4kr]|nr:long-chain fatty acid--CoA ligase [Streptomyces sp. Lzd4kr]